MSGNCELGRGLRRREKNANKAGAERIEKPAPDARAAPPEAHESLIGRKTGEEVPLTGLSFEKQADLLAHVVIEAHDDLVNQADFHALTGVVGELAGKVSELADAQKDLADAQKRTEKRVEELTDSQRDLADAQKRTEQTVSELVTTQRKMLIRLDRLDGHMLEDQIAKNLPAFLGREFRRCRVLERAEFVEGLEGRLPEDALADLMRADAIATAKRAEQLVHIVVEASCTADSDDIDRAVRRTAALAQAGFTAIGIVACEAISPQTLDIARGHGLRVITSGWLLPEAA